ncbi:pyridoxamine 5'-phosphate oxidase family protein [Actinacidiphila oryziradicis]|uniref:Pyridoxamine 5'-phosphate oxidase family protein n=1 Tax=Actinacidiphila oryziradicis TaxID=2571141 RepID=A0A4U0RMK7_9ACTN|nr:pyridoxamine 5'-phosphate oxidase family protein [Actinacidiphila oryziradicis]TJZ96537.1 pyridoxamine 5'-phosphate oxidase family protein [Actinacidiphila oryziradicis]
MFLLLALAPIGRIVYTQQALPAVLPVNFWLDRDFSIVLRTSAASRMARAVDNAVVAFEVDQFDEAAHTGWSVVVTGRATLVTDPGERKRLRDSGVRSWTAPVEEVFITVAPELVTGRALEDTGAGRPS